MKMYKVFDIRQYSPFKDDKFMFDANIWMYIFCPIGNYEKHIVRQYSSFLKKLINTKAEIIINLLILSEFINRYMRLEFEVFKSKTNNPNADFKRDFRVSSSYKKAISDISSAIRDILKISKTIDDKFSSIDIGSIILKFEKQMLDFNDLYCQSLCQMEKVKIVTNDRDFRFSDNEIITGNPKILKS